MRGIMFLVVVGVALVAAGVMTVSWNNGTASVKFNEEKAKERAGQLIHEGHVLEAQIEQNVKTDTATK